ncbi:MAG: hypothetical protein ACE5EF_00065 [Dehalococcoidia bacterium]
MRVSFSGPLDELKRLAIDQRVVVQVEFDVDFISLYSGEDGSSSSTGGGVRSVRVISKRGGGGLDPTVTSSTQKLVQMRSMGSHG